MTKTMDKLYHIGILHLLVFWIAIPICLCEEFTFSNLKNIIVKHGHDLSLACLDDNIELYYEGQMKLNNLRAKCRQLSFEWEKLKSIHSYTNYGPDPNLYLIFFYKLIGSHLQEKIDTALSKGLLNVIYIQENERHNKGTAVPQSQARDLILEKMVDLVVQRIVSTEYFPTHMVSDWKIENFIFFGTLRELRDGYNSERNLNGAENFPQQKIPLFNMWYYPIYKNYGRSKSIHDFLQLINHLAQKDGYSSWRNRTISPGEYVHIWSIAVRTDLRLLAYGAFGWTREYREQFNQARKSLLYWIYEDTFPTKSFILPEKPCHAFKNFGGDGFHQFGNVVICSHHGLTKRTIVLSKVLAQAWSYANKAYGPLGPDPYLFVEINYQKDSSENCIPNKRLNSYLVSYRKDQQVSYRATLSCFDMGGYAQLKHDSKSRDSYKDIETFYSESNDEKGFITNGYLEKRIMALAQLVLATSKETGNLPALNISKEAAVDILAYDILISIGQIEDAKRFAASHFDRSIEASNVTTFWSRDWFFPLYTHFEGSRALNAFLEQLSTYWPKKGTDYISQLNFGEFVHFWSTAVNTDLRHLAEKSFGWTEDYRVQFMIAREEYLDYNYTDTYTNGSTFSAPSTLNGNWYGPSKQLIRLKTENDVAFYSTLNVTHFSRIPKSFQMTSDAWRYAKQTFGPFQNDPNLYVILHHGKHEGCFASAGNSFNTRSVIDCRLNSSQAKTLVIQDLLMEGLARVVQDSVKWDEKLFPNKNYKLTEILVYDIYKGLKRTNDSSRWIKKIGQGTFGKANIFSEKSTKIFQTDAEDAKNETMHQKFQKAPRSRKNFLLNLHKDWYFPIYKTYGGTDVVQKFLKIVKENLPRDFESSSEEAMSVGEFVHFWSGAVGMDLESVAVKTFGLGSRFYRSVDKARRRYPKIKYSDYIAPAKEKKAPNTSQGEHGQTSKNYDLIIGISVPICLIVLAVVVTIYLRQRREINILKAKYRKLTQSELKDFYDGAHSVDGAEGNSSILSEPFNKNFEIPRSALELGSERVLGSGEYGLVLKGTLKMNTVPGEAEQVVAVAVKTPKPDVDVTTFKALLSELKVMGHIGTHENIIQLMGAVTVRIERRELLVALEFCAKGDLLNYMRRNREDFTDLLVKRSDSEPGCSRSFAIELQPIPSTSKNYENTNNEFTALNLLEWSRQIANGMNFIASKNVIHGDLAARNVLLTADRVAKISDFGLSRQLVNYTNYTKKSDTPMPWRWMALESLLEMKFSTKSDVWAFGVTLFEIFSLGSIPYPGGNWTAEFVEHLSGGYRLSAPQFGNGEIHNLMLNCMRKNPSERLNFSAITIQLQDLKRKLFPKSSAARANCIYVDVNSQDT